ncbi:MAG: hypothetical protein M1816_001590 [Peltula sp. TS41687]|nr:MAG: hypothetical protein M1816_001590 [Peltula sp. TS41687]
MASSTPPTEPPEPTMTPSFQPLELSFALPRSAETQIHLHVSNLSRRTLLLFLTTTPVGGRSSTSAAPLGSFVYALPDRRNPKEVLATSLYAHESTLDLTTRLARLLVRKFDVPVYVGNSISFATAGLGGTVEEELGGVKRCVEVVVEAVQRARDAAAAAAGGS